MPVLMLTKAGPKLLEYNVRFGDPECQVLCLRLMSDLLPALLASADGALDKFQLRWQPETALTVVMAAEGYPGPYRKGTEIRGLDQVADMAAVKIFHAGTRRAEDGRLLADGGRVLGVSALGKDVAEARERAYRAVDADRLAGGLLPPRHRLAGDPAPGGSLTARCFDLSRADAICRADVTPRGWRKHRLSAIMRRHGGEHFRSRLSGQALLVGSGTAS